MMEPLTMATSFARTNPECIGQATNVLGQVVTFHTYPDKNKVAVRINGTWSLATRSEFELMAAQNDDELPVKLGDRDLEQAKDVPNLLLIVEAIENEKE